MHSKSHLVQIRDETLFMNGSYGTTYRLDRKCSLRMYHRSPPCLKVIVVIQQSRLLIYIQQCSQCWMPLVAVNEKITGGWFLWHPGDKNLYIKHSPVWCTTRGIKAHECNEPWPVGTEKHPGRFGIVKSKISVTTQYFRENSYGTRTDTGAVHRT